MLEITNGNFIIKLLPDYAGKILKDVVKDLKMPYWISAGTALGLYRDGEFIPGDTDLDIAMEYYPGVEKDACRASGGEVIRTIYEDGKPMQVALMRNDVIVDFYFHHRNGENIENHGQSGWTRMKAEICLKPQWIKTKYGKLPIPQEEYFEIRYGKDWRTPQDKKAIFYEV
jgi:hypothetical protein